MLDVHPPHHPVHTWRDFLIHIATICVGLLIAIGLEQTVEALHRRHESVDLIQQMSDEAGHNLPICDLDTAIASQTRLWTRAAIAALQQATPVSGVVTVTLPPKSFAKKGHEPSRAVWAVAKTNGKAALLPDNFVAIYDRLDYEAAQFEMSVDALLKVEGETIALQTRLGTDIAPGAVLHLSTAKRDEVIQTLAKTYAASHDAERWSANWAAASDAVIHRVQSRDDMDAYLDRRNQALPK